MSTENNFIRDLAPEQRPGAYNAVFADAAARLADPREYNTDDIYHLKALQVDTEVEYYLSGINPTAWSPVSKLTPAGDVTGPVTSTPGNVPVWNGGKDLGDSGVPLGQLRRVVARDQDLPWEQNTNNSNFEEKLSATFSANPSKMYVCTATYMWSLDSTGVNFIAEMLLNGNPIPIEDMVHAEEPQDSGGALGANGTDQQIPGILRRSLTGLSGATTISVVWAPQGNGVEANMGRAELIIEEVDS